MDYNQIFARYFPIVFKVISLFLLIGSLVSLYYETTTLNYIWLGMVMIYLFILYFFIKFDFETQFVLEEKKKDV